jgi:hypothetical protein
VWIGFVSFRVGLVAGSCENCNEPQGSVVILGGLVVSVLAIILKVRGFIPGRGLWIFKDDKNP